MSKNSRRALREKNIARKCLEKAVQEEIDEFIHNHNPLPDPEIIDCWDYEDFELEQEYNHDDDDYEQDYIDDYYYFEEQEQLRRLDDEYYEDFYSYLDDELDSDDDWNMLPLPQNLEVGSFYKKDNKTYQCVRIERQKYLIDVLTGEQAFHPGRLEKVG